MFIARRSSGVTGSSAFWIFYFRWGPLLHTIYFNIDTSVNRKGSDNAN